MKKATSGEVPVYFTMETSLELPKHLRVGRYNWHHRELCSCRNTKWMDRKIQVPYFVSDSAFKSVLDTLAPTLCGVS